MPLAQARKRPSGLKTIARQFLLSSRVKFVSIRYDFDPVAFHNSTPVFERTAKKINKKETKIIYDFDNEIKTGYQFYYSYWCIHDVICVVKILYTEAVYQRLFEMKQKQDKQHDVGENVLPHTFTSHFHNY